ncbi:MAG: cytochrome c family protein [Planctomycetota bacterium]
MRFPIVATLIIVATGGVFSRVCALPPASITGAGMAASRADLSVSPMDPSEVLSTEACVKCHAPSIEVWRNTPHSRTFEELHRRPEARQIAGRLGLRSIKHEGRCVACHYTTKAEADGAHVIAGVSCESCHGEAKNWLDVHHNYGGEGLTRHDETPAHRIARLKASVAAGMRNPVNVYRMAQSCLRCHTTADEELVNVGGHSAGSLEFELVSWSQGTIRHNFIQSDGKKNKLSSPNRIRVMFVAGMIAELESSLRATAVATQKANYGFTVAKRADRARKRLVSVASKIENPYIDRINEIAAGVTLKLNNRAELVAAADKIALQGIEFAEMTNGATLKSLDGFIPKKAK